jgi:hypothetical protein
MRGSHAFNVDNTSQLFVNPSSTMTRMLGAASSSSSSSARTSLSLDTVAEFERKYRAGRRLGSFSSLEGSRRRSSAPSTASVLGKRSSSDAGLTTSDTVDKRRRMVENMSEQEVSDAMDAVTRQMPSFMSQLEDSPGLLELHHVGPAFAHLQTSIQDFASRFGHGDLTPNERCVWPLHQLETRHLPLMLITQYLADGSQYGWRNFFTVPESRTALVFAVIGEWLTERVFNHTAFGFDSESLRQLEDMDREYLHFDAVLRNKKRAKLINAFLSRDKDQVKSNLKNAVEELVDELLLVLDPVLVPGLHLSPAKWRRGRRGDDMRQELTEIVHQAATLHRAIRVLGENGTIVRIAPSVQKGSEYHSNAPFVVVNPKMVKDTRDHAKDGDAAKLLIKMTCFSRVEAYVPHGPDAEELMQLEKDFRKEMIHHGEGDDETFDWEEWVHRTWPELPRECIGDIQRKYIGKALSDAEGGDVKMHGAYVTTYMHLANHHVYCEWDVDEDKQHGRPTEFKLKQHRVLDGEFDSYIEEHDDDDNLDLYCPRPIPKSKRITLKQAVARAVRESGLGWRYGIEAGAREIWNFLCLWEPLLETSAVVWFVQSWIRGGYAADGMRNLAALATSEGRDKLVKELLGKYRQVRPQVLKTVKDAKKVGGAVTDEVKKAVKIQPVETATPMGVVPGIKA